MSRMDRTTILWETEKYILRQQITTSFTPTLKYFLIKSTNELYYIMTNFSVLVETNGIEMKSYNVTMQTPKEILILIHLFGK